MTTEYKLYRDGTFFDLRTDPFEERPRQLSALTEDEAKAAKSLKQVLEQFADARPAEVTAAAEAAAAEEKERPRRQGPRRARRRQAASDDGANTRAFTYQDSPTALGKR
jgi:hypothetical protein